MSKQNNRLVLKIIVFAGKLFLLFKKYSIIVLKEVMFMNFKEVLNKYLKELNCSSKKLSNESGLSESVISRYRSGERTPVKNSEQLNKLTNALFNIAKDNNKNKYTFDKIESDFNSTLASDDFDYTTFSNNLNTLITSLNINTHEMSKYIVFDASHISRIRYGKAKPSNPVEFSNKICSYIFCRL